MEVFDNDLKDYQNKLAKDDLEIDETYDCNLYNKSNCCNATFLYVTKDYQESDVCSDCKEHADTACIDCEQKFECMNDNINY